MAFLGRLLCVLFFVVRNVHEIPAHEPADAQQARHSATIGPCFKCVSGVAPYSDGRFPRRFLAIPIKGAAELGRVPQILEVKLKTSWWEIHGRE